uniref:C104.1 n=1 Tax=synthetic construct TaxID=32630 RepID=UPI0030846F93
GSVTFEFENLSEEAAEKVKKYVKEVAEKLGVEVKVEEEEGKLKIYVENLKEEDALDIFKYAALAAELDQEYLDMVEAAIKAYHLFKEYDENATIEITIDDEGIEVKVESGDRVVTLKFKNVSKEEVEEAVKEALKQLEAGQKKVEVEVEGGS